MSAGYMLGERTWRGHPQYLCEACAYDSLREDDIIEHVAKQHGMVVIVRKPLIDVVDAHGRDIDAVVVTEQPADPGASE